MSNYLWFYNLRWFISAWMASDEEKLALKSARTKSSPHIFCTQSHSNLPIASVKKVMVLKSCRDEFSLLTKMNYFHSIFHSFSPIFFHLKARPLASEQFSKWRTGLREQLPGGWKFFWACPVSSNMGPKNLCFLGPQGGPTWIWDDLLIIQDPLYNGSNFWLWRPLP